MRRYELDEKVTEIMKQAETLGLRQKFDSGLIILEKTATADPETAAMMVKELGKYLTYVHPRLQRRSTAARAKQLLGQRVWFQDRGEWMLGTLETAEDGTGGLLGVSIDETEYRGSNTFTASPERLLIIMEEETTSANGKERSGKPRPGIFERLRLSSKR